MEEYSSGLAAEAFWFIEFKQFVKLKVEGKSWDEIKELCVKENLLGIPKENRAKRTFGSLKKRIMALDDELLELFLISDISTQKIIALIAIMKSNKLFGEFIYEVYRDKVILGIEELTKSDISIFFNNKQEQNESIAKWTDGTLIRLGSSYTNYLVDASLLTLIKGAKAVMPPVLDIRLGNFLKDNGYDYIFKAVTGVR